MDRRRRNVVLFGGGTSNTPVYILADYFTNDVAAGAVNGTAAVPGPGNRSTVDVSNVLSVAGTKLVINGIPAALSYLNYAGMARVAGRAVRWEIPVRTTINNGSLGVGFVDGVASYKVYPGIMYASINTINIWEGNTAEYSINLGAGVHRFINILRPTGGILLARVGGVDGISGTYSLLFPSYVGADAVVYPDIFMPFAATTNMAVDNIEIIDLGGVYGQSFGLATAWTQNPTSPITGTQQDGWAEISWTPATNEVLEISVRQTDTDNRWIVRCDQSGGTIKLFGRQTGTETEYSTGKTQTWTVGTKYRILIQFNAAIIRSFVGFSTGALLKKNEYTSASFNQTATGIVMSGFTTALDFAIWPSTVIIP